MKNVPKLNDGKIYIVTAPDGKHLGDYRTFEEALECARAAGAIISPDWTYGKRSRAYYGTSSGGVITIGVELVDPLLRGKS